MAISTIKDLITALEGLESFALDVVDEVVIDDSADLNRDQMADLGVDSENKTIQPEGYDPSYAAFKKRFGRFKNTAFVDLKLSGKLHDSIKTKKTGKGKFDMSSKDPKFRTDIAPRYGEQILGLTDRSKDELAKEIVDKVTKGIITKLR